MRYNVALYRSDKRMECFRTWLPGCWSQESSKEEALVNIREAIREYLAARAELLSST